MQAIWLALLIAEPAPLHACAMHATGHGSHGVAEHDHHGDHAAPEQEDGATSHCQCLGDCCAAAATTFAAPVTLDEARVVAVAVYAPAARARIGARAADLQLPFATAPPVDLTA